MLTLKALWERWKKIAHAIGTFQARVILTVIYAVVLPLFALIARTVDDRLQLRRPASPRWLERRATASDLEDGRKQFS